MRRWRDKARLIACRRNENVIASRGQALVCGWGIGGQPGDSRFYGWGDIKQCGWENNVDVYRARIRGAVDQANLEHTTVGDGMIVDELVALEIHPGTQRIGDDVSVGCACSEGLGRAIEQIGARQVEFEVVVNGGNGGK